jgi:hypothetical protein
VNGRIARWFPTSRRGRYRSESSYVRHGVLCAEDHAAGRFLQRAGDNADFRSALFQAANYFNAIDVESVAPHVGKGTDIYLPAGSGCFVGTVIGARSGTSNFLYARAATWIDGTMLHPDQTLLPKAEAADRSVAALLLE